MLGVDGPTCRFDHDGEHQCEADAGQPLGAGQLSGQEAALQEGGLGGQHEEHDRRDRDGDRLEQAAA